jgi:uncharacterized protein (TIGR03663 family)
MLFVVVVVCILILATWFRLVDIESRLFHNDEGVNYHFIQQLRLKGYYPYSHLNYHGPIYFYMTAAALEFFSDDGELGMRLSAILAGMLLIGLLLYVARIVGYRVALIASLFVASSASLVFYSRYAIHESFFLLTSAGVGLALYCWHKTRQERFIWLGWVSLALLIATKETFIISLFCIFWAFVSLGEWRSVVISLFKQRKALFFGSLLAAVVVILIFTGGLVWPAGLREMFLAVPQWVSRNASDQGHHKPFLYYLGIFRQSEPYLYLLGVPQILQARALLLAGDLIAWIFLAASVVFALLFAPIRSAFILPDTERKRQFILCASLIAICYCIPIFFKFEYTQQEQEVLQRALLFFPTLLAVFTLLAREKRESESSFLELIGKSLLAYILVIISTLVVGDFFACLLLLTLLFFFYCLSILLIHCRPVAVWFFSPQVAFLRFSAVWALLSLLVYSYIKYKTPWLIINITFPAILVLSALLDKACQSGAVCRATAHLLTLCIAVVSLYYSYQYNFVVTDTQTNDFYYVHTTPGMGELVKEINEYWQVHPDARLLIGVPQYWPLPYYLRANSKKVAYLKTSSFKKHSNKYDILILPKIPLTSHEGWLKRELRLSDVQETHTFFKLRSDN